MASCLTLKKSNCRNCYKCIRNCPVKSIRFSANQAHIIGDECILCGHCFVVCPQNAKEIVSQVEKARVLIQSGDPVIASLAPSFVANYEGVGIKGMREALKKLGFADAEETAIGATMVKTEYERILKEEDRDILISSCCHSLNLLVQKYFPELMKYLADVKSPMQAHCIDIKKRIPNAKTVFIGPCVAKKDEAEHYEGIVDAALTFEELSEWMQSEGVVPEKAEEDTSTGLARFFPTTGGVLKTMAQDAPGYRYLAVDGPQNCIEILKDIEKGKIKKCFIEMSICVGACVGGPVMEKYRDRPLLDYLTVADYAGPVNFEIETPDKEEMHKHFKYIAREARVPSEAEITHILHKMGKYHPEDELNCGTCGYNTCRDKAIAVYQGKAETSMCLPFLKDKAENFSDIIVKNMPSGIVVLNSALEVQQINKSAIKMFGLYSDADILGDHVIRILDPTPFMKVLQSGKPMINQPTYIAEYDCHVVQSIIPAEGGRMLICLLRDVTEEVREKENKERITRATAATADDVIDKQMRIVQEIASLLGETAADTKIALTKLKESIENE